jgi:hypothetical protein
MPHHQAKSKCLNSHEGKLYNNTKLPAVMTSESTTPNPFSTLLSDEAQERLSNRNISGAGKRPDEFIIYFAQWHTTFRLAELQALAEIEGVGKMEILKYSEQVDLPSPRLHLNCLP